MKSVHQIVKVISPTALIDMESYQHQYWADQGESLILGYYVVLWPSETGAPAFDQTATYVGPFGSDLHAKIALMHCLKDYSVDSRVPVADRLEEHVR